MEVQPETWPKGGRSPLIETSLRLGVHFYSAWRVDSSDNGREGLAAPHKPVVLMVDVQEAVLRLIEVSLPPVADVLLCAAGPPGRWFSADPPASPPYRTGRWPSLGLAIKSRTSTLAIAPRTIGRREWKRCAHRTSASSLLARCHLARPSRSRPTARQLRSIHLPPGCPRRHAASACPARMAHPRPLSIPRHPRSDIASLRRSTGLAWPGRCFHSRRCTRVASCSSAPRSIGRIVMPSSCQRTCC